MSLLWTLGQIPAWFKKPTAAPGSEKREGPPWLSSTVQEQGLGGLAEEPKPQEAVWSWVWEAP